MRQSAGLWKKSIVMRQIILWSTRLILSKLDSQSRQLFIQRIIIMQVEQGLAGHPGLSVDDLIKQKDLLIQQRINRSISKLQHIKHIQEQYRARLRRKSQELQDRMNRSLEMRRRSIQKITEKCKVRHQYEQDKSEGYRKQERLRVNRDWRESNKLAQWLHTKGDRNAKTLPKQVESMQTVKSRQSQQNQQEKKLKNKRIIRNQANQRHMSPIYKSYLSAQKQKQRQALNLQQLKVNLKSPNFNRYGNKKQIEQNVDCGKSNRQGFQKSTQAIKKAQANQKQIQQEKLKQYKQKLEKLEKARNRKAKYDTEKQKKIKNVIEMRQERAKQVAKSKSKTKPVSFKSQIPQLDMRSRQRRVYTQVSSEMKSFMNKSSKNELFKQWEEDNKIRQLQLFEKRLRKGEAYIDLMKSRTLRLKTQKQVEDLSIQKKLYMERIKVHELSFSSIRSSRSQKQAPSKPEKQTPQRVTPKI